jgi:5-methylcytosine-specific restriction endonuclease McrA
MRCSIKYNLEVHHKRRDGGNSLDNAEVLCQRCHANTDSYGSPGITPPAFSEETKEKALRRAGYQCECTRTICGFH